MRNIVKQNFYIYYTLENSNYKFLYAVRNCKRPERTKEYKKVQMWMLQDIVKASGYCDSNYFEDYKESFLNNDLQIKPYHLKK